MKIFENFLNFDKILNSFIQESPNSDINLILYVIKFFENLKNEVDLYSEEFVLNQNEDIFKKLDICNREKLLDYIKEKEIECLLNCHLKEDLLQSKLNVVIKQSESLIKELSIDQNIAKTSEDFLRRLQLIIHLSIELRKEIFENNLIFLKKTLPNNCTHITSKLWDCSLLVIEPFCLDDFQIDLLKFEILKEKILF